MVIGPLRIGIKTPYPDIKQETHLLLRNKVAANIRAFVAALTGVSRKRIFITEYGGSPPKNGL